MTHQKVESSQLGAPDHFVTKVEHREVRIPFFSFAGRRVGSDLENPFTGEAVIGMLRTCAAAAITESLADFKAAVFILEAAGGQAALPFFKNITLFALITN